MGTSHLIGAMVSGVRDLATVGDAARGELRDSVLRWIEATRDGRAVLHPLGFLHHEVAHDGDLSLRLHVWPGGPQERKAPLQHAHDHVWDLTSAILMGEITNVVLAVEPDDEAPTHGMLKVVYDGTRNIMLPQPGLVRVSEAERRIYGSGDAYTLPAGTFHDSEVPEGVMTATLVIADRGLEPSPRVLSPVHQSRYEAVRPPSEPGDLAAALRAVSEHLETAPEWTATGPRFR